VLTRTRQAGLTNQSIPAQGAQINMYCFLIGIWILLSIKVYFKKKTLPGPCSLGSTYLPEII